MSFLDKIKAGRVERPYFVLLYGMDGVGKTTFASQSPDVLFMDLEHGTAEMDLARLPGFSPQDNPSLEMVYEALDELQNAEHSYRTLVIDSISKLEPLIRKQVVQEGRKKDKDIQSVEDFAYGKGHAKMWELWHELMLKLAHLRNKMNVILIGHAIIKKFDNPQVNSVYDRWTVNVADKAASILKEGVDAVLFATEEISTHKDESKKVRAYGEGRRVIYTERRPSHEAKNRYGLPFQLALDWNEFDKAARAGEPDSMEAITERIRGLLVDIRDEKIVQTVEEELKKPGNTAKRLAAFENKLKQIVAAQES